MKKLAVILLISFACTDEETKYPFRGAWEYQLPESLPVNSVNFNLSPDGLAYNMTDITVDGEIWDGSPMGFGGNKISSIVINPTTTVDTGVAFFYCRVSGNAITADSVWYFAGEERTTLFNQTLTRK